MQPMEVQKAGCFVICKFEYWWLWTFWWRLNSHFGNIGIFFSSSRPLSSACSFSPQCVWLRQLCTPTWQVIQGISSPPTLPEWYVANFVSAEWSCAPTIDVARVGSHGWVTGRCMTLYYKSLGNIPERIVVNPSPCGFASKIKYRKNRLGGIYRRWLCRLPTARAEGNNHCFTMGLFELICCLCLLWVLFACWLMNRSGISSSGHTAGCMHLWSLVGKLTFTGVLGVISLHLGSPTPAHLYCLDVPMTGLHHIKIILHNVRFCIRYCWSPMHSSVP